jgi:hypothetical protein
MLRTGRCNRAAQQRRRIGLRTRSRDSVAEHPACKRARAAGRLQPLAALLEAAGEGGGGERLAGARKLGEDRDRLLLARRASHVEEI